MMYWFQKIYKGVKSVTTSPGLPYNWDNKKVKIKTKIKPWHYNDCFERYNNNNNNSNNIRSCLSDACWDKYSTLHLKGLQGHND